MEKSWILFRKVPILLALIGCSITKPPSPDKGCGSLRTKDSLIDKYLTHGAQRVNNLYNNPQWGAYCDSLIHICPEIAEAYQLKAIPYIKNGDYHNAYSLNDQAVRLDPENFQAYRGFLKCMFTKDYEGSLQDFQIALKRDPKGYEMDHTYPFYMGICRLMLKEYLAAEQDLRADINIQLSADSNRSPHYNSLLYMGIAFYKAGKLDSAEAYLNKCLTIYAELPEANFYLALVEGRKGKPALMIQSLELAGQYFKQGYGMNEDNDVYVYYPFQLTGYEIDQALDPNGKGTRSPKASTHS